MIEEYRYHNENYKIIDAIKVYGIDFIIGQNSKNEFTYMKITQLSTKTVFTPLDNLIKVLEAYNNKKIYNIKKIMDYFMESLNISLNKNKIKIEDIKDIINKFPYFVKDNILITEEVNTKDLKKINKFLNSYETKTIFNKLCNIYGLMLLISIIGISIFAKNLINWYSEGNSSNDLTANLISDANIQETDGLNKEEVIDILDNVKDNIEKYSYDYWILNNITMLNIDFTELLEQNENTVAWLYVNNTNINYPVVQSGDNSFYLDHSFDKSYNNAGWIFADYRSNLNDLEKNTVIYGHGRKDNTMFGTLDNTLNSNWYTETENQIIKLSTPSKNMLWQIVSIYTIPSESYYLTHTFENDQTYQKFLNTIIERSIYNFDVPTNTNDHILTLSTCLDNSGNRIVVHAKLIKIEEK